MRSVIVLCLLGSLTAQAADREFRDVVRVISGEFHTRPVPMPWFGLVNVVTAAVHPAGTKHIDLAVFEQLASRDRDGRDLQESILNAVGRAWKPFVKVHSRRAGHEETVLVYMRQQGPDWKLLIASVEQDEATVVQLELNAGALARWMAEPEHSARHWNASRTE